MVALPLVSRTGRHLQRYNQGCRQVVGCIPYRYKSKKQSSLNHQDHDEDEIEVLLISAQKLSKGMLFPKGGWESDESISEAASRETLEEAGVVGIIEPQLGQWRFKSNSYDAYIEGYMFPLFVTEQLELWPEKNIRQRKWMNVAEVNKVCQHGWMKDALQKLVRRIASQRDEKKVEPCSLGDVMDCHTM